MANLKAIDAMQRDNQIILDLMADGEERSFGQIMAATGIPKKLLENRIRRLRAEESLDYLGRRRRRDGINASYYKIAIRQGQIAPDMRDRPQTWLQWGGWAA
jgi:hypothetical protein